MAKGKRSKRNYRIPTPHLKGKQGRIVTGQPEEKELLFSFKYMETHCDDFHLKFCKDRFLRKLLERMKDLCKLPFSSFIKPGDKALRAHKVDWDLTEYKDGFPNLPPQLRDEQAWQFQVSKARGRVFGVLLVNVFFVVWLDPEHKVYPYKN